MSSRPCKDCTKRHLGCHDRCPDYQATKPTYKDGVYDEARLYLVEKHHRLKKQFKGRD